jgi:hypothetical protein
VLAGDQDDPVRARLTRQALVRDPAAGPGAGRRPLVSVIIPMYNYGHFLPAAVHSTLAQQDVQVEVIIVDDASTDDSAAVADRLAAADPRVTALALPVNGGPARAFNHGYATAAGEFIVRLDADDLLTPRSLARAAAVFDAFPAVGLVYGHPVHFHGPPPPPATARTQVTSWTIWSGPDWIAERCRRGVNCITTPEAIVRDTALRQAGVLSTGIKVATDIHLWLRLAAIADVGHLDGPDQAFHREHPASITAQPGYTQMTDLIERKAVFDDFFSGPGKDLPAAPALAAAAAASLADEALLAACRAYDRGRTTTVNVPELTDFASLTCPAIQQLPHWRPLRRRQRLGPRLAATPPLFTAAQIARRARSRAAYRHWERTGL